jgi:acetylornithine aminotransferase
MTIALKYNLLISVTASSVIRIVPPLIINDEEAQFLVQKLKELVTDFLES